MWTGHAYEEAVHSYSSLQQFAVISGVRQQSCRVPPQMLMDLGKPTYEADFEQAFLADAAKFYKKEAAEYIACSNAPDYMRKVCTYPS